MDYRADDAEPVPDDDFAELLREVVDSAEPRSTNRERSGSWLVLASASVLLAGVAVIGASLVIADTDTARTPDPVVAQPTPSPDPVVIETPEADKAQTSQALVDDEWVKRIAERTDIPERALTAYAGAAARISTEQPRCGLGWNTLAGIGFVESEHGAYGGSQVSPGGNTSPPIIGIPLDGTVTDRIPDTDGGELDGDTVWDRAVGPMQFIPSTWRIWGSDGNGDGVADPQNIDDAAYSAARYLCSGARDLRDPGQWIAAVAAYNDTVEYNNQVADAANHYAVQAEAH